MASLPALTLHQPWATLVVHGLKQYETRSWSTNYRGWLAIHAAKRKTEKLFRQELIDLGYVRWSELPLGCVVGVVELVHVWTTEAVLRHKLADGIARVPEGSREWWMGNYEPGRYAWQLDNAIWLPKGIPARGYQRIWRWHIPPEHEEQFDGLVEQSGLFAHDPAAGGERG